MRPSYFAFFAALVPWAAFSASVDPQIYAGKTEMNGYKLADVRGFEKWPLTTVRYRTDNGEIRFVYANQKAWDSLLEHKTDYPDGSIFVKVGFASDEDPAFTSSRVPSGARRYQIMVRNKAKHRDSDGWGYAIFDADGKTFPEDPKIKIAACAACHRLVAERGFVFSQPISLTGEAFTAAKPQFAKMNFVSLQIDALPENLRNNLGSSGKKVRVLQSSLSEHLFQGTLDEIRPILAEEVLEKKIPAVLVERGGKRFSAVTFGELHCNDNEISLLGLTTVFNNPEKVNRIDFCARKK